MRRNEIFCARQWAENYIIFEVVGCTPFNRYDAFHNYMSKKKNKMQKTFYEYYGT